MVNNDDLVASVKAIIDKGDLASLTFKIIYKTLEETFGRDLAEHKSFLRETVAEIIRQKGEAEAATEAPVIEKAETAVGTKEEDTTAFEENQDHSVQTLAQEDVPFEVSEKELQLQRLLMERIQSGGSRSTRSGGPTKRKSSAPHKSKTKKHKETNGEANEEQNGNESDETGGEKKKRKAGGGFVKPYLLSPALAGFLGEPMLPRTEVVKRLHAYIKEHNLQNEKDRRKIHFDEPLQQVFKCKTTDFFKMNRLISKHVQTAEEV